MESMINRTYTISDADTKPFCAATSVLASYGFRLALSQLWNNKAITAFAALLCILFTANTHAQTLEWVKSFVGKGLDGETSIAVDNEGNVYTTGSFRDTVDFDPGTGVFNLSAFGESDIFIQKLDAQGNFLWAKSFGWENSDHGHSIAIDAANNVYTAGYFSATVDFDPGIGVVNLSSVGQEDIFIQKLDANGNFLWAKSFGGILNDRGNFLAIDDANNVYTTGSFARTVDFDPGIGVTNLSALGSYDIFIQKLDAQGNFLWAKSMGKYNDDVGISIAIDAMGNIFTTGYFIGTVDFDPGIGVTNLSSIGFLDIFIQKLDKNGNFLWAKSFGGKGFDIGLSIVVDTKGNVYTTGYFEDTVDFDPGTGVANLSAVGETDIFIQKLDADGNSLWAKSFGGSDYDSGSSIVTDAANNVYTTGTFAKTVDFDPGTGVANLTAVGEHDIFIHKLDAQGNLLWAKTFGGTSTEVGSSIAIDAANNVYITGYFGGTVDFDPGADVKNLSAVGDFDIFVHKMKQTATGVADIGNGIDISLYPNPSNGFIHISLNEAVSDAAITVTDLQGKTIHSEHMSAATKSSIDIQAPNGVYFVHAKTAKGQSIMKFIKE